MERNKRSYGENKPERGRSPFKKREDSSFRDSRSGDESRSRRPRVEREERSERPSRAYNSERPKRDYGQSRDEGPRRDFNNSGSDRPRRDYNSSSQDRPRRDYGQSRDDRSRRNFNQSGEDRPRRDYNSSSEDRPKISIDRKGGGENRPRRDFSQSRDDRPRRDYNSDSRGGSDRPRRDYDSSSRRDERPRRDFDRSGGGSRPRVRRDDDFFQISGGSYGGKPEVHLGKDGLIRLNKYISNSGICSRREADELIKAGTVTVNGEVVTEMGFKVTIDDVVTYGGEKLVNERKKYLLLNKPKGFITTLDDPQNRKTVLSLISGACKERLYPVGRLDRNTTGLLLFTNDGEITKKLTHPSFGAKKIYHVELDKALTHADMQQIMDGVELEDGRIAADDIQYVGAGDDKKIVGIVLHSGKNRIVRRIFASLGYEVFKLDRVSFAGLTKKNLPRGNYRFLTDQEVSYLKMLKAN
ncbi:MAG: pseudouridine synthase [Bacteroidales bacterium]|nr:pseudouridine synthase [Bacteroidales bacterium]MDD4683891.1 pseudouridine synthase [Bacteroidales bacterium]